MFKNIDERQTVLFTLGFAGGIILSNVNNPMTFIAFLIVVVDVYLIHKHWN